MSQTELAARVGLTPGYVSLVESGARTPSLKALEALAGGLGIPMHVVLLLASEETDVREGKHGELQAAAHALIDLLQRRESETT